MGKEVKAAILVGGKSRRIGTNKSFLPFGEARLLDVVIQKVRSVIDEIYLVTSDRIPYQDFPLPLIIDRYAEKGPLGGIFTALATIDAPFVFVTAGDMPFIDPGLMLHMIDRMNHGRDAVVPAHNGKREPLFAIYGRRAKATIEKAIKEGDLSVHRVLARLSIVGIDEETVAAFSDHAFFNINTRGDYEQALRILKYDGN